MLGSGIRIVKDSYKVKHIHTVENPHRGRIRPSTRKSQELGRKNEAGRPVQAIIEGAQ